MDTSRLICMNHKRTQSIWLSTTIVACFVAMMLSSCSRDVRLTGKKLRNPKVETVTVYGQLLDPQAEPEKVAYAALRAIRDDFLAPNPEVREEALDKQFSVCAPNAIIKKNNTANSGEEFLYNVVSRWTPAISHYVDQFPQDWDTAKAQLIKHDIKAMPDSKKGLDGVEVWLQVRDPGAEHSEAVVVVWLVQESGYWRVVHVGFQQGKRSVGRKLAAQDAGNTSQPSGD